MQFSVDGCDLQASISFGLLVFNSTVCVCQLILETRLVVSCIRRRWTRWKLLRILVPEVQHLFVYCIYRTNL